MEEYQEDLFDLSIDDNLEGFGVDYFNDFDFKTNPYSEETLKKIIKLGNLDLPSEMGRGLTMTRFSLTDNCII